MRFLRAKNGNFERFWLEDVGKQHASCLGWLSIESLIAKWSYRRSLNEHQFHGVWNAHLRLGMTRVWLGYDKQLRLILITNLLLSSHPPTPSPPSERRRVGQLRLCGRFERLGTRRLVAGSDRPDAWQGRGGAGGWLPNDVINIGSENLEDALSKKCKIYIIIYVYAHMYVYN